MSKYSLLHNKLTISVSDIHGLGLFAKEGINKGTNLGISHVPYPREGVFPNDTVRTATGGAINCSSDPNCELVKTYPFAWGDDSDTKIMYWSLYTSKRIKEGEELTLDYSRYPCGINQEQFDDLEDAINARIQGEIKYHGETKKKKEEKKAQKGEQLSLFPE